MSAARMARLRKAWLAVFKVAPPFRGVGMARAAAPQAFAYAPRPVAPQSLARPGWVGFPNSHAPNGTTASDHHQAQWVKQPDQQPKREPKIKRHKSPLTTLAELPLAKLPKLPRKYAWQTLTHSHSATGK